MKLTGSLLVSVQLRIMSEDTVLVEFLAAITCKVLLDAFFVFYALFQGENMLVLSALLECSHPLWERVRHPR